MDRKHTLWNVRLVDDKGQTHERTLAAFWDPEKVNLEHIALTARAEAIVFDRMTVVGVTAELAA